MKWTMALEGTKETRCRMNDRKRNNGTALTDIDLALLYFLTGAFEELAERNRDRKS